jgi:hypothetical protein
MSCTGRYAEAWEFAAFWCVGNVITGVDDSGGVGNPSLQDSYQDFIRSGVKPNQGIILYNTTQGTSGAVTAVTNTTLTATGVTWDDGDGYRITMITAAERSTIEHYLNVAASDIHAALAASGACDCTLADWAEDFLVKLNIIDAAAYYECPCGAPQMTPERKGQLLDWMTLQLSLLREGKLEVCHGATGSDFPAIGWAEQTLTEFNTARIIYNQTMREG